MESTEQTNLSINIDKEKRLKRFVDGLQKLIEETEYTIQPKITENGPVLKTIDIKNYEAAPAQPVIEAGNVPAKKTKKAVKK